MRPFNITFKLQLSSYRLFRYQNRVHIFQMHSWRTSDALLTVRWRKYLPVEISEKKQWGTKYNIDGNYSSLGIRAIVQVLGFWFWSALRVVECWSFSSSSRCGISRTVDGFMLIDIIRILASIRRSSKCDNLPKRGNMLARNGCIFSLNPSLVKVSPLHECLVIKLPGLSRNASKFFKRS